MEAQGHLAVLIKCRQKVHVVLDKTVIQTGLTNLLPHIICTKICDTKILFPLLSNKCSPNKHIQLTMKFTVHSLTGCRAYIFLLLPFKAISIRILICPALQSITVASQYWMINHQCHCKYFFTGRSANAASCSCLQRWASRQVSSNSFTIMRLFLPPDVLQNFCTKGYYRSGALSIGSRKDNIYFLTSICSSRWGVDKLECKAVK